MMTSEQKTSISSLMDYINSDLYAIGNISNTTTLTVPQTEQLRGTYLPPNKWEIVLNYIPLEFFQLIQTYDEYGNMINYEPFDQAKYKHNPKLYAFDKYGLTNMWRPIMILNRCPSILDFDFKIIRYFDIKNFSMLMAILISRMERSGYWTNE